MEGGRSLREKDEPPGRNNWQQERNVGTVFMGGGETRAVNER